ncbi:hypothetical protein [Thalassobium sp. R2A62]|jgi:hypothetical protein|uniref:hypothetical protein n=1 Tax=Thalassobium sp. R2A62 TaxID=633131 RepID=UPI0001B1D77E|nr:hypothetical protein [Thalassobium sp. R2A62]EET49357.1 hypothetical protein TR2A62_2907 [Thalassobium sp. R2A62]MDG1340818.1 hypothetical protein [Paracoccaceae bacterium]MDG1802095.1 hypothetical protein [Paracoccaceae bacterium]MDG2453346.1 hypothetical protein [Paracoccaceae bacterium]
MELIISLISGAVGGNVAGGLLKNLNLGMLGNSIAGIVGGGAGGAILANLGVDPGAVAGGAEAAGLDIGSIISQGAGGLVGGGGLMAIIGVVKNMMAK